MADMKISSNEYNCVALKPDGSLFAWGSDNYSQVSGAPSSNDFIDISTGGGNFYIGIKNDGSLFGWGRDFNSIISTIPSGNDFVKVVSGYGHAVAIKSDGTLVSWGDDTSGVVSSTPTGTFIEVACSYQATCAIRTDGSLVAWGNNTYNMVSNKPSGGPYTKIAGNNGHFVALRGNGSLVEWGDPSSAPAGYNYTNIACGRDHSLALKSDGSLLSWGDNSRGQVTNTPSGNDFIQVACGRLHSLALKEDGTIVVWGDNSQGQVDELVSMLYTPTVPTLIGNTSANPIIVSASSEYSSTYYAYKAFDKVDGSWWNSDEPPYYGAEWLKVDYGESKKIQGFSIKNHSTYKTTELIIQGSNDDNNWTNIDTITPIVEEDIIPINSSGQSFRYWRALFTEHSPLLVAIVGFQFYEEVSVILNKYLLKDLSNNNIYNILTGSINLLGNGSATEQMFLDDGLDTLDEVNQALLDQFSGNSVELLEYNSEQSTTNRDLDFSYYPDPILVLPTGNIDISSITNIDSFSLTANTSGSADLKIIVSIDEGVTYKTFNGSIWETVDHTDLSLVKANGMTISEFNALTSTQIMDLVGAPDKIRFGYYMEITDPGETCETDELSLQVDMNGEWEKAQHMVDYNYAYLNSTTLQIELFSNGDFKINY
jgi:alpha-tubulin suppressor-like RCC1 family protein